MIINMIRKLVNKLIAPHTYNNDVFVKWLRSNGAKIGVNTRFVAPKKTLVDESRLDYIQIGDNCCFSHASIIAHDYSWYVFKDVYNDFLPDGGGEVIIGNNCFIGYQSVVLKGTIIGDNVIIGARSVVKGSIPSNTVWAGVPAKQICTLDEYYQKHKINELNTAIYRRDHLRKTLNRDPTISELGWFAFMFLERTNDNYYVYLKNLDFNGIKDNPVIKEYFFNSKPTYSFKEFLSLDK